MSELFIFTVTIDHIIAILWLLCWTFVGFVKNKHGYYDYTMTVINYFFGLIAGIGFVLIWTV